ncbi:hypothetical protein AK812_SmicGene46353, partial [Symbiodinium microadriaticum]
MVGIREVAGLYLTPHGEEWARGFRSCTYPPTRLHFSLSVMSLPTKERLDSAKGVLTTWFRDHIRPMLSGRRTL